MYVLIFSLSLGIMTYITNTQQGVDSSQEFLRWRKQDILVIAAVFGAAILCQALDWLLPKFCMIIYLIGSVIAFLVVNKSRENYIKDYKKQVDQILESIDKLIPKRKSGEEIDYSDLPFTIEKEGDQIKKITVLMKEPNKFNDGNCINGVYSLKRYFPYYDWKYTNDFPRQECVFEGMKLPPNIARWPGSDLRASGFIPLGLSGEGEVGWKPRSISNTGKSMYVYEDGSVPDEVNLPNAPHCLCIGSSGGGKAIWVGQELW